MIHATQTRLSLSYEWWSVTALCAVTCVVGLLVVRELRVVPQALASARASVVAPTASVPPEAVSIPTLVVGAQELRVGDEATEAIARLTATATLAGSSVEHAPLGVRQVRSYRLDGSSVIVVLEPFETGGPLRVAAIYLH